MNSIVENKVRVQQSKAIGQRLQGTLQATRRRRRAFVHECIKTRTERVIIRNVRIVSACVQQFRVTTRAATRRS